MRDLTGVVEQLRNVREAQRKFLRLWAVEQAVIMPALDRVAADMESVVFGPICWDASALNGDEHAGPSLGD